MRLDGGISLVLDENFDALLHAVTKRLSVNAVAKKSNAISHRDAVLGQESTGLGQHDVWQIRYQEGADGAGRGRLGPRIKRRRSHHDGFVLSDDENLLLVDADGRCSAVRNDLSVSFGIRLPRARSPCRATRRRQRPQCAIRVCFF